MNSLIADSHAEMSYVGIPEAMNMIMNLGKGALLAKFDVSRAYRLLPVHSNLRNDRDFNLPRVKLVMYGSETVRYRDSQLWSILPVPIRHSTNLIEFKIKIKASGSIGYAAINDKRWFAGRWPEGCQDHSIAVKELLPIVLAAHM